MLKGVKGAVRRLGPALVLAGALAAPALAQAAAPAVYDTPAAIKKAFPALVGTIPGGVRLRLKTGNWVEIFGNSFSDTPPYVCWYAPALNLGAVCRDAPGLTLTILIDLRNGHQVQAPGRAALTPDPTLVTIGPADPHKAPADSLTLVRISPTEIFEEGGAEFSGDYGPGSWVDAQCYRLIPYGPGPTGWLEKTPKDWRQVSAAQSTVCQARHAH